MKFFGSYDGRQYIALSRWAERWWSDLDAAEQLAIQEKLKANPPSRDFYQPCGWGPRKTAIDYAFENLETMFTMERS